MTRYMDIACRLGRFKLQLTDCRRLGNIPKYMAVRHDLSSERLSPSTHHSGSHPETQSLVDRFRAACRDSGTAAGVAALYAYESQIPAVSESKIEGLRNFYGYEY
jgi:pyrroloquinoline quinone (PQQ) biosynthesis protein C